MIAAEEEALAAIEAEKAAEAAAIAAEEEAEAKARAEAEAAKAEEERLALIQHQSPPPAEETDEASTEAADSSSGTSMSAAISSREIAGFDGLSAGSSYADARPLMVEAGWSPRELDETTRLDALDENEQKLVDAGYAELEGCETYARTICRFEYVDGEGKIAAILTAGDDATVIDAFLMDVR